MSIDIGDPSTWPDRPFLGVSGCYGQGTVIEPSQGQSRKVLLARVEDVVGRYNAGEQVSDIVADTNDQNYDTRADLETDWKPV